MNVTHNHNHQLVMATETFALLYQQLPHIHTHMSITTQAIHKPEPCTMQMEPHLLTQLPTTMVIKPVPSQCTTTAMVDILIHRQPLITVAIPWSHQLLIATMITTMANRDGSCLQKMKQILKNNLDQESDLSIIKESLLFLSLIHI